MSQLQSPFGTVSGVVPEPEASTTEDSPPAPVPSHRLAIPRTAGGKALLYDGPATRLREGRCLVRELSTHYQLCAIEGGTLRAPAGEADDRSDAFALAIAENLALAARRGRQRGWDWALGPKLKAEIRDRVRRLNMGL